MLLLFIKIILKIFIKERLKKNKYSDSNFYIYRLANAIPFKTGFRNYISLYNFFKMYSMSL